MNRVLRFELEPQKKGRDKWLYFKVIFENSIDSKIDEVSKNADTSQFLLNRDRGIMK